MKLDTGKAPVDYLSPELKKQQEQKKAEFKERLNKLPDPEASREFVVLATQLMVGLDIVSGPESRRFTDDDIRELLNILYESNKHTTELADYSYAAYQAEKLGQAGQVA